MEKVEPLREPNVVDVDTKNNKVIPDPMGPYKTCFFFSRI